MEEDIKQYASLRVVAVAGLATSIQEALIRQLETKLSGEDRADAEARASLAVGCIRKLASPRGTNRVVG